MTPCQANEGQMDRSEATTPEQEHTSSAGETGEAEGAPTDRTEIIIGEIPAADEPTIMLWTARCTDSAHDLLGHFDSRPEAEEAGQRHLASHHHRPG